MEIRHYKTTEIVNLFMIDKLVVFHNRKMQTQLEKPPFIIDHYQLLYMVSGAMTLQIDEQTLCLETHHGLLLSPGTKFQVLDRTEDAFVHVYGFMCRGDLLLPLCHQPLPFSEDEQTFLGELAQEGQQCFRRIMSGVGYGCEVRAGITRGRLQALKNKLEIFFIKMIESRLGNPVPSGRITVADAVHDYLTTHVADRVTLLQIAESLSLSVTYIKREFSKKYGRGIIDYLLDLKIDLATQLIRETTLNFTQIAEYLSFESEAHFSKTFSKRTGKSPSAYLKELQKESR